MFNTPGQFQSYIDEQKPFYMNASIIYSNRKLIVDAANKAVNVKRSNDNATSDIGYVNNMLDTAALSTFVGGNGATIQIAYNQADPANNLIKAYTNYPKIVTSGTYLGGLACDRGGSGALASSNTHTNNLTKVTMFLRAYISDVGTGGVYTLFGRNSGQIYAVFPSLGALSNWFTNGNDDILFSQTGSNYIGQHVGLPGEDQVMTLAFTLDLTIPQIQVWRNGILNANPLNTGTVNASNALPAANWLWGIDGSAANASNHVFTDIIVFERILSDGDIALINDDIVNQRSWYSPPSVYSLDPYWTYVALLCHMDGINNSSSVVDSSPYARTIIASTAPTITISTAQYKFGTASLALATSTAATGASHTGNVSASLTFGTGDFTIECWLYLASITATFPGIYIADGSHTGRFYFAKYPGTNQLYVQAPSGTDIGPVNAGFTAATWTHVAWSRTSGTSKFFVSGNEIYSGADTNNYQGGTSGFTIGRHLGSYGADFIDDLRITVGVGRYVTAFIPPNVTFPNA
jgi:hypothetical protein